MKRIVIIGGGITGLAAAHRLVECREEAAVPFDVTLLESSSRLGGVIQTEDRDGFLLERGPDSFISEKPEALNLVNRLGLQSQLIETNNEYRRSFIVRKGKLRPVPEGFQLIAPTRIWPFVTSDIFSLAGKARMALDLVLPRGHTNGSAEDESLAEFVRRRLGREALERMAQPMVGGIYTSDPERLSLRATMPRFHHLESEHRSLILGMFRQARTQNESYTKATSGARYSLFLSFERGMQTLIAGLSSKLPSEMVRLRVNAESLSLDRVSAEWTIRTNLGPIRADAVCFALPAYASARLLGETDSKLAGELEEIQYASTATVNLGYRRNDIPHELDGFGFVVPFIEKRSLVACTFSSIKFAGRAPAGSVLLRGFVGGALQPEMFLLEETELVARVRADLRDLLGIETAPVFTTVSKWERSMPQYHVGHLERVGRISERLRQFPGLKLAGNALTGAGIPDCIRSGEAAAVELVAFCSAPAERSGEGALD